MAFAMTNDVVQNGPHIRVTGVAVADATTAPEAVLVFDISAVTLTNDTYAPYTNVKILNVTMAAASDATVLWTLEFHATPGAMQPIIGVSGGGSLSHNFAAGPMGGLRDPKATGGIGDIYLKKDGTAINVGDECFFSFEAELT